jgi:hypothetical protein
MAMSPDKMTFLAEKVREVYLNLEYDILKMIARKTSQGIDAPNWQQNKLADLQKVLRDINTLIEDAEKASSQLTKGIIEESYFAGIKSAEADYINAYGNLGTFLATNTSVVNNIAITSIVAEANGLLKGMNVQILRKANDAYRKVVADTSIKIVGGVLTKRQAIKQSLNEFANMGISGFTDKAGRSWNLASYSDMALRTAVGRSAMVGHETRLTQLGEDLVIVSNHPDECPVCQPYEGKVYSLSGVSTKYPPLAQARAGGLFHPNCGHVSTLYVEGFTKPFPQMIGKKSNYEQKQNQRAIERDIRKWKRREAVATDSQSQMIAQNKIKEKQLQMRNFIKETGRKRRYDREQINL